MYDEKGNGLVALQERVEDAATAVKATTTAMRNKNKFTVPDEIREMAAEAAKCRDPARRKLPRKSGREARRVRCGKNKANGLADCLVTEMLQRLPVKSVYEVTHWFEKRFKGECRAQRRGKSFDWCFSKSQTPGLKRGCAAFVRSHCFVCFQSGTRRFWWTCYTRRRSRLSGAACTWEPKEGSTVSTCRPC